MLKIRHLLYYLLKAEVSGLKRHSYDERDFDVVALGWGEYTPKQTSKVIPTISTKNQGSMNTCQWNATTSQKEIDEGCVLSVRSLVGYGYSNGLISGNGFSDLRSGQKMLQDYGILEQGTIPENIDNWDEYKIVPFNKNKEQSEKHKIKTYWRLSNINQYLKALDDGRPFTTGMDWYTAFNQGGGFSNPWIISKAGGWCIGGHAVLCVGYNLDYFGKQVFIFKNSYGESWGGTFTDQNGNQVNGAFAVEFDYFLNNTYGCYVNLDMPKEKAKNLNNSMLQKIVRMADGSYWFIKDKKKQKFENYLAPVFAALGDEFGCRTATESEMKDLKDYKFFG